MKANFRRLGLILASALPALLTGNAAHAVETRSSSTGTSTTPPAYVSVTASQPLATEPGGQSAVFTLSRYNTNNAQTVTFILKGGATNGVDYATVATNLTLAAGQSSANILITPIAEPSATGYKTVELEVPEWRGYSSAVAYIAYNYANAAPTVSVVSPTNGASFLSRPNITISARAADSNGWVTSVSLYAGATLLTTVSNPPFFFPGYLPFKASSVTSGLPPILTGRTNSFLAVWTNVPPGSYALTAVATDNAGLQTTSAPSAITVTTTLPEPAVKIVNPVSGASFPSNAPINLFAAAGEVGGAIATVEFLAGGQKLGTVTNNPVEWPDFWPGPANTNIPWKPFTFIWTNAPVGSNSVTALATDNNGTQVLSAPVTINVLSNSYQPRWPWRR